MKGLTWKINRIKAMGGREILFRVVQVLSLKAEEKRLARGWEPLPTTDIGSRSFLFGHDSRAAAQWSFLFSHDDAALDNLIAGKIDFFGHSPLNAGHPIQWHRDPVTGIETSAHLFGKTLNYRDDTLVGNVKFLWELGRHQHLIPLAAAYAVRGEQKYKDAVIGQIESWIVENPFNRGIHWCTALEVSLRLISWAVVHSLLHLRDGGQGLFEDVDNPQGVGKSIYQHAWFIAHFLSRYSSANNHLIGELTGLWTGCQVFDMGFEGGQWAQLAKKKLELEAKKQVFPDGVNKEQSSYYHLWVLEYLLFARLVGVKTGEYFSPGFEKTVYAMADFLEAIIPNGGLPPQIGDADDGFVTRFEARWPQFPYEEVLSAVRIIRSGQLPRKIYQKSFWYALMAGVNVDKARIVDTDPHSSLYPRVFPEGGYAILGDGGIHLVFDAGSLGYPAIAAHGHADALSFCLALNGRWWLVDPGTYAYHSTPEWRNYFRGTAAHNTLTVDDLDQSEIGGPFLWVRHAPVRFEGCTRDKNGKQRTAGWHSGYRGIVHHRTIVFMPETKEVQIKDTVTGSGRHDLAIHFHFAPEISIQGDAEQGFIATCKKETVTMTFAVDRAWTWQMQRGTTEPISGWYSPNLGKKIPAMELRGNWQGELPVQIITVIQVDFFTREHR